MPLDCSRFFCSTTKLIYGLLEGHILREKNNRAKNDWSWMQGGQTNCKWNTNLDNSCISLVQAPIYRLINPALKSPKGIIHTMNSYLLQCLIQCMEDAESNLPCVTGMAVKILHSKMMLMSLFDVHWQTVQCAIKSYLTQSIREWLQMVRNLIYA